MPSGSINEQRSLPRSLRKVKRRLEAARLLEREQAHAGQVAERLQGAWPEAAGTFRKVMPTDYRRVLEAASAARSGGRDEVEAIMASTRA